METVTPEISSHNTGVILAAGGLLARDSVQGTEIAIIHRRRYADWCLPKGKLHAGESWQDAALREVKEETGIVAQITGFAGVVGYETNGVPKVVIFWKMAVKTVTPFQPSEEVAQVVWLPVREALQKLDHPAEKQLLGKVCALKQSASIPYPRGLSAYALRTRKYTRAGRRLAAELRRYPAELECLVTRARVSAGLEPGWASASRELFGDAVQAFDRGIIHEAYGCLHAARRMAIYGLTPVELAAKAEEIRIEAAQKLSPWRKQAVEAWLGKDNLPAASGVVGAALLCDEHHNNTYYKIALLRDQLAILLSILAITLALLTHEVLHTSIDLHGPDPGPQGDFVRMLIFTGILGATASVMLTLTRTSTRSRIPEQIVDASITAMRPLLGGAAALIVYFFLNSGILDWGTLTASKILAICFAAGFSEKLLIGAVKSVGGGDGKDGGATSRE